MLINTHIPYMLYIWFEIKRIPYTSFQLSLKSTGWLQFTMHVLYTSCAQESRVVETSKMCVFSGLRTI